MGFIHISNRLSTKHKKLLAASGRHLRKNYKKFKIVEKYSLSYWYCGFYLYLGPFGCKKTKQWLAARCHHLLKTNRHHKIQKNILYQIAIISFIHISNRLVIISKLVSAPTHFIPDLLLSTAFHEFACIVGKLKIL